MADEALPRQAAPGGREKVWALTDQALSSLSNMLASVLAARSLDKSGFGIFAVAFAIYILALGVSRAWSNEPLVIAYAAQPQSDSAVRAAAGAALATGIVLGTCLLLVGIAVHGTLGRALVTLAIFLPPLLVQDLWRIALIMRRRAAAAAANDFIWVVVLILAFGVLQRGADTSAPSAIVAWGLGAAIAACVGCGQLKLGPSLRLGSWYRDCFRLSTRYTGEFLILAGASYLLLLGVARFGGVDDAASYRGAQVLLGPLNVLFLGVSLQLLPQMVRQREHDTHSIVRLAARSSIYLSAASLLWGLVVWRLPTGAGVALVGDSWPSAQRVVPAFTWYYTIAGATVGATTGLRALAAASRSLRTRVILGPAALILGSAGALIGGPSGAVVGLAIASTAGLPVWWRLLSSQAQRGPDMSLLPSAAPN